MTQTLLFLAEFSFELGLIDVSELAERRRVALWAADDGSSLADPRELSLGQLEPLRDSESEQSPTAIRGTGEPADPNWLELLMLGKWLFTRSDPDPYRRLRTAIFTMRIGHGRSSIRIPAGFSRRSIKRTRHYALLSMR